MKYTECPNKESCDASAIVCAEGRQCNYLAAKLAECQRQRDELLTALEKSRAVFDSYVQLHLDKNPPDGEKAARNAFHRGICDIAINSVKVRAT